MLSPIFQNDPQKGCRANSADTGQRPSPHQRFLKAGLKLLEGAVASGKSRRKMLNGLKKRVGLRTRRGLRNFAQAGARNIQPPTQSPNNVVKGLISKRQARGTRSRRDRLAPQEQKKQLPEQDGGECKTRQHIGQKDRKRAPTASALTAVRAKDTLAPQTFPLGQTGIIAIKETVTIE